MEARKIISGYTQSLGSPCQAEETINAIGLKKNRTEEGAPKKGGELGGPREGRTRNFIALAKVLWFSSC